MKKKSFINESHCEECVSTTRQSSGFPDGRSKASPVSEGEVSACEAKRTTSPSAKEIQDTAKMPQWIATLVSLARNDSKAFAFTLAEVLITLTIIGVIAVLTIPNLLNKWREQHTISAVKEAYSLIDNALRVMYLQEGDPLDWTWPEAATSSSASENNNFYLNKLSKYLKFSKICGKTSGCTANDRNMYYKTLNNDENVWGTWADGNNVAGKGILANGMTIATLVSNYSGQTWYPETTKGQGIGEIRVDINGKKGPNRYGYDVFYFMASNKQLIPRISAQQKNWCKYDPANTHNADDGKSCADWIIKHNNLDYQKRNISNEW